MGEGVAEREPCRESSESVEAFMIRERGVRRRGNCSRELFGCCCCCCVGESESAVWSFGPSPPAGEAGMGLSCFVGRRSHSLLGRFGVRLGSGISGGAATFPRPTLLAASSVECSSSNLKTGISES